jgi:ribonuclease Z
MMPLPGRWLSSLIVRAAGSTVLFDCGEGTQLALREASWGLSDIDYICISHFHADHVSGLVGILLMLANAGRKEKITILGPAGLERVVEGQRLIAPILPYDVNCCELRAGDSFEAGAFKGTCAAGIHGVPCLAYRLDLPRGRRFLPEKATALGVPVAYWKALQSGQMVAHKGQIIKPDEVLGRPRQGLAVAYVTDTRPTENIADLVQSVDVLICEATLPPEEEQRAVETGHMTFAEAAHLAKNARVHELWLTHFSPAVSEPEAYLSKATAVFPRTRIGKDGMHTSLRFRRE